MEKNKLTRIFENCGLIRSVNNMGYLFNKLKTNSTRLLFYLLIPIAFSFLLFSCESDDDYYSLGDVWISMGFIQKADNGDLFWIKLDNGDSLVPVTSSIPYFNTEDSQRVMVNYTILDEVGQSTSQFYVKINNMHNVLYKDIFELTPSNNDSIGNDPVKINQIWKSNNLLNIEFSYTGGEVIHYINLVRPAGDVSLQAQPIQLELRHNARDDGSNYRLSSIVTFDLRTIKIEGQDSVSFIVKSTDFEGNEHSFNSTYYY